MFSENDRRNILVGAILVIVLTIACVGTVRFYKSAVPENREDSTVNVTEAEYTQALAKWQARNASEYDITIHSGQDDLVLRVAGGAKTIEVLQHIHAGSPVEGQLLPGSAVLRTLTVERLFEFAGQGIAATQGGPVQTADGKFEFFEDYTVRFDATLGYPTYFAAYRRTTRPSREIVWRDTRQAPIEIREVKVIK